VDNWNYKRQQDKAGAELSSRLYQELVAVKEYSEIILSEYINQIDYTDLILTRGQQLDIDSLIESD
jgi:hypothetical protein